MWCDQLKKNVRQDRILEILAHDGELPVDTLVAQLSVSVITVRVDLAHLPREGRQSRTHGGAVLSGMGIIEFKFREKTQFKGREKQAIAEYVASLIEPGMAISLDTGTTTLEEEVTPKGSADHG